MKSHQLDCQNVHWTRTKLMDMTRWIGKAHGGLGPTQRSICNYGKLELEKWSIPQKSTAIGAQCRSAQKTDKQVTLYGLNRLNIGICVYIDAYMNIYIYMHFITISKKEAMNLKRSRKMYMRVFEGMKGKGEMP